MKLTGVVELTNGLKKRANLDDIRRTVLLNGSDMNTLMKRNAIFVKGYKTGTTKRSINLKMSDMGFTATVAPTTHYAVYVEYGTINMEAQPFVRPTFHKQAQIFKNDMDRLVK